MTAIGSGKVNYQAAIRWVRNFLAYSLPVDVARASDTAIRVLVCRHWDTLSACAHAIHAEDVRLREWERKLDALEYGPYGADC